MKDRGDDCQEKNRQEFNLDDVVNQSILKSSNIYSDIIFFFYKLLIQSVGKFYYSLINPPN